MGCGEVKDKIIPELLCQFESKNEQQKEFCIKLKNKLENEHKIEKTCKYIICSQPEKPFTITLKIKEKVNIILDKFEDSEEQMDKTIEKLIGYLGEIKNSKEVKDSKEATNENENRDRN